MVVDPWYRAANFARLVLKNINFAAANAEYVYAHAYLENDVHSLMPVFYMCDAKSTSDRYGRQTCVVIFHSLLIFPTQKPHIPFCIDKARKRSFTEVALNSVL